MWHLNVSSNTKESQMSTYRFQLFGISDKAVLDQGLCIQTSLTTHIFHENTYIMVGQRHF